MPDISSPAPVLHRWVAWLVGIVGLVMLMSTNLPWQLDDYDQAKQAFTSFEMVKQGHWLYQHSPRGRVATKPPLVGWISAGIFEITRSWDLAWRFPSFATAIALALVLGLAARGAYGQMAGLAATGAFTFNLLTPRLATLVRTDMPLAFVLFLIGLTIWRKIQSDQPWDRRDRFWVFAWLTAGMLIKGPIVYAFLFPGILYFQWWRRKTSAGSAWCGWWPWVASLTIFLVWAIAGIRFVPGFYDQVVVREFLGRFGETIHRPQPLYFYIPHLLHKFAPWSVLLFAFGWILYRARRGNATSASAPMRPDMVWLLCWAVGGVIVMSCIPSKRVDRIFPVIPPLCLLLGAQVSRLESNERHRQLARVSVMAALALAVLFAGGYSAFKVVSGYRGRADALVQFGRTIRADVSSRAWRYETIAGRDEGMILYLDKPSFADPTAAVTDWNAGNLDALVVPAEESDSYARQLHDAAVRLTSAPRAGQPGTYVLFVRTGK